MVVYLPIAFLKDWFYNLLKRRSSKSGKNAESGDEFVRSSSPLIGNGVQKNFEVELGNVIRKETDLELDLSTLTEIKPLVAKYNDINLPKVEKALTTKEIAACGFYIAPIWFITEVSNSRLITPFCSWAVPKSLIAEVIIYLFILLLSVSIKCCPCTYKCCEYNSFVIYFWTLHSFHWCGNGPRHVKCSKSSCRLGQHGRGCNDDSG